MWQIAVGVLGLLLVAGVIVWYKLRTQTNDTALAENAATQANAARGLAEKQLAQKNEQEREALDEQVTQILAVPDKEQREQEALDLLARFRGLR